MSLFIPTSPQANDNLDFSQGQLLSNNSGLDTVFGIDHYKFSDATANKGFHNKVTTPVFVDSPPITGANPVAYAFQDSANVGVLQYSRGPNNAVPTPITMLQSPSSPITLAPAATTNVLDFTGIPGALAILYAADYTLHIGAIISLISWNGTAFGNIFNTNGTANLTAVSSGNILQIKNNSSITTFSSVRWTLQFLRMT